MDLKSGVEIDHCYNKLIYLYLKTRCCKYYNLNTTPKSLTQSAKTFDTNKINNHTVQCKILEHNKKTQTYLITGQPSQH